MSLFNKNPNEVAYTGGKNHWADVIKNTGPGELLIWRQPEKDFNTNSTLIVMPGEENKPYHNIGEGILPLIYFLRLMRTKTFMAFKFI